MVDVWSSRSRAAGRSKAWHGREAEVTRDEIDLTKPVQVQPRPKRNVSATDKCNMAASFQGTELDQRPTP
jgi:hypothetical protein